MTLVLPGQAAFQEGSPYTFLGFGNKVLPVPLPGRVRKGQQVQVAVTSAVFCSLAWKKVSGTDMILVPESQQVLLPTLVCHGFIMSV